MIRVPASLLLASMVLAAQAQQGPAIGRFGFDTTGMDLSVPPGDDIYAYANGTWANSTPIPPDKSSVGQFTRLADINTARLREILDAERSRPASLAGAAYASYLDAARVERLGMRPFKPILDRIHAIRTRDDVMAASAEAWREGVAFPLSIVVDVDNGAPDRYVAVVSQAGLGMPDRSYYLDETAPMRKAREAYLAYLTDVLDFLGESDAARRAQDLLDFETAVARDSWTPQRTRDAKAAYNPMSTDALSRATPGFDVGALLRRLGDRTGKVVVTQPDAVAAIAKRVGDSPVQVLRDALLVGEFHAYAQFLPSRAYAIDFAFFGKTIDGSDEAEPRSTRAVAFAVAAVPDEVSRPYVARYFTPETKASAEAMVKEIIAAMDRRIDRLDWMTPATRSRAHAKLAAFTAKIGYPDRWHDYRGLALKPDDLFGNALRARRWQQAWNIGKAGKPPYRWEWSSTPMTVDAFADFPMIAITFPAAILQPPFFDPHADMAVNYGGIGAVIGHELSHQFDDQGSRYDPTGRLTTWWTEADLAAFASRTDKLVRQFSAYEPLPGMHIDGRLTLGENLADLAGLYVAHDAYEHALGGKPAPDIDGFSGDQRFFLGWAQMWRYKYREADMRRRLLTNPHSPGEQRVWTMRNLDAWYPAFGVRPGQRLYLEPSQRVRVW